MSSVKRPGESLDNNVSPPPTKRKVESTTTSKAVASFFKPVSQKEPEKLTWRIVHQSLLIARYQDPAVARQPLQRPVKVAAFDLDDTLITPAPGSNRWARSDTSWRWWNSSVPGRLRQLHEEGYLIVILSNQGAVSLKDDPKKLKRDKLSLSNLKNQIGSILRQLDLPISVYAATEQDRYRKPRIGMWEEVKEDYDLEADDVIDVAGSFYVGDAAGRENADIKRLDHATSDRDLATNIGITFQTPEEFFLKAVPEPFIHKFDPADFLAKAASKASTMEPIPYTKTNTQDIVMFCGSPGAGKSSFYWQKLQPLGYERVNQDILKSRDRCIRKAREYLESGSFVAVDNTNRDAETRAHWVLLAKEFRVPIRCVLFTAPARLCEHNAAYRAFNKESNPENRIVLPPIAIIDFARKYTEPQLDEGFQDITKIDFEFTGTDEQRKQWSKFWVSKYST